jgi:hypothetical protein
MYVVGYELLAGSQDLDPVWLVARFVAQQPVACRRDLENGASVR